MTDPCMFIMAFCCSFVRLTVEVSMALFATLPNPHKHEQNKTVTASNDASSLRLLVDPVHSTPPPCYYETSRPVEATIFVTSREAGP